MLESECDKIYRQYAKSLYLYALSLTKNEANAQDLVSDAFLKAFLVLENEKNIMGWLVRVVRNRWIDQLRKKKYLIESNKYDIEWVSDPKTTVDYYIKEEKRRWLYHKIYELNLKEREIMLMSLTMNLNDQQIAQIMHLSVDNIRVIRYRIKERLTKEAKEELKK